MFLDVVQRLLAQILDQNAKTLAIGGRKASIVVHLGEDASKYVIWGRLLSRFFRFHTIRMEPVGCSVRKGASSILVFGHGDKGRDEYRAKPIRLTYAF